MSTAASAPEVVTTATVQRSLGRLERFRDFGILAVFIALFVTLSIASDSFLTTQNLLNVLDQWAPIGIMACAGTLVIIAGGFDLSVGAILALTSVIAAKVANSAGVDVGIAAGVGAGLAVGIGNGLLVTAARINPFMATLSTQLIVRGLATVISGGLVIVITDSQSFTALERNTFLNAHWSVWIWAVFALAMGFLLAKTNYGRAVYAVGGNADAARLSGIRVGRIRLVTFALSGLAAGIGGILMTALAGSGQASVGVGTELSVIAAVVVGGTSIMGGEGAVWRSIIGVLLLAMIGNGFNLLGVDSTYQQMVQGSIILLAVGIDVWTKRRH